MTKYQDITLDRDVDGIREICQYRVSSDEHIARYDWVSKEGHVLTFQPEPFHVKKGRELRYYLDPLLSYARDLRNTWDNGSYVGS